MFEKITDFDGKQFLNLWGGFSCECFVDGINTFVMFYIKDEEVLSLSGNDANDILDFVLSEYYENENSTIEDGFSTWLMGHYDNVMPTFDKNSQPILVPHSALEAAKEEKVDNQNCVKSANGVEPKFKVGDWVVNKLGDSWHIDSFDKKNYQVSDGKGNYNYFPISKQDEMHLWNIQEDAKVGDVLFLDLMCGFTFIYSGVNPDMAILYSFLISNDGKDVLPYHIGKPNTGIGYIEENKNIIRPATKKERDLLFQKKKELKKLVNIDRQNTANKVKSKENKYTLTTDEIPLSVLYKIILKDWKRQNRIIEKQKKKINKLQMRISELSSSV